MEGGENLLRCCELAVDSCPHSTRTPYLLDHNAYPALHLSFPHTIRAPETFNVLISSEPHGETAKVILPADIRANADSDVEAE